MRGAAIRVGFALTVFLAVDAAAQCSDSKPLIADAIRKGESISIRPFHLLPWSYPDNRQYGEEEERKLQESFAKDLSRELQALGFKTSVGAASGLVLEGSTTNVDDTPKGVRVKVSAVLKRSSDGAEVLRISECSTSIKINEGLLGASFIKNVPGMLESFYKNIANDIAVTIANVAKPGAPGQAAPPPATPAKQPESVQALIAAVRTQADKDERTAAIKALGKAQIKDPGEVQAVIDMLGDVLKSDTQIRPGVFDITEHKVAMAVLVKMKDPRATEAVVSALKSRDEYVRLEAAKALGSAGDSRTVEPLIAALADRDPTVRSAAISSLARTKDSRAVQPLMALVKDQNAGSEAIAALAALKDPRAVDALIAALNDGRVWIREAAAKGLGEIKDPRAVESLAAALNDKINTIAICSAESLAKIGDPRAIPPLIDALRNENKWTRAAAADALKSLTGQDFGEDVEKWRQWAAARKQ